MKDLHPERKADWFSIKVDPRTKALIKELALADRRTVNNVCRIAVEDYLQAHFERLVGRPLPGKVSSPVSEQED